MLVIFQIKISAAYTVVLQSHNSFHSLPFFAQCSLSWTFLSNWLNFLTICNWILFDHICKKLLMHIASFTNLNDQLQWICICLNLIFLNSLRPRQNGRNFSDDIFKCIFLNKNIQILIKISLNFVPKGSINDIPSLVQIMVWRRPSDKPLSEPIMVSLLTHLCVTRPQWVKSLRPSASCMHQ